jgi:uncharacterized protein YndB with AHSA1/START domain
MAASTQRSRPGPEAGARELVITRVFDAPRELVFAAWTTREHLLNWAAPTGFAVVDCDGDLRPGGFWRETMRSPEGREYRNGGTYREILPPEKLVYTFAWEEDGKRGHETLVTVVFEDDGGKTKMTFRQATFESVESRDGHRGGWSESLARLAAYLPTMARRAEGAAQSR